MSIIKVKLIISKDHYEKFKENYKDHSDKKKFYANCEQQGNKEFYIKGQFVSPKENRSNIVVLIISSANERYTNAKPSTTPEEIIRLFNLNGKKGIKVQLSPIEQINRKLSPSRTTSRSSLSGSSPPSSASSESLASNRTFSIKEDSAKVEELQQKNTELQAQLDTADGENKKVQQELEAQKGEVDKLTKEKQDLKNKNKTTEQPKQSNGARYTATVGIGLATGLAAFTALECTMKLDIWIMVGIAVASALAVGGVTYFALTPNTKVSGTQGLQNAQNTNGVSC